MDDIFHVGQSSNEGLSFGGHRFESIDYATAHVIECNRAGFLSIHDSLRIGGGLGVSSGLGVGSSLSCGVSSGLSLGSCLSLSSRLGLQLLRDASKIDLLGLFLHGLRSLCMTRLADDLGVNHILLADFWRRLPVSTLAGRSQFTDSIQFVSGRLDLLGISLQEGFVNELLTRCGTFAAYFFCSSTFNAMFFLKHLS